MDFVDDEKIGDDYGDDDHPEHYGSPIVFWFVVHLVKIMSRNPEAITVMITAAAIMAMSTAASSFLFFGLR